MLEVYIDMNGYICVGTIQILGLKREAKDPPTKLLETEVN
jgi:hypothetical protein